MDEKGINYVTATHELKEEDLEFEKKNIVQYTDNKDEYKLSLLHLLYPTFKYNREDININKNNRWKTSIWRMFHSGI